MHKKTWILALLLLEVTIVHAQNKRLYIGTNASNASKGLPSVSCAMGFGYQAGGDVQLGKGIGYLQPGVQYSVTHIRLSHPSLSDTKSDLWISGVKIPIMLGMRKRVTPSTNLRFFAGPSFIAVTKVKHKNMGDTSLVLTDKNYHDVEWARHLGAGVDYKRMFVDLGFQKGLTYVFTGPSKAKSNLFYLNVGVRF